MKPFDVKEVIGVDMHLEISRGDWIRIFPALNSENRLMLLEYFYKKGEPVSYSDTRDENGFTDGNLVYHLNLLLSAKLIDNKTEKTEFGRHPHSFYVITELGKNVLETLSI